MSVISGSSNSRWNELPLLPAWVGDSGSGVMKRPYCRRIPRRSMPVLKSLYSSAPSRTLCESDLLASSRSGSGGARSGNMSDAAMLANLASHQLIEKQGDGYTITVPGVAYCIAREYGLSFSYLLYLAYLYSESRDAAYALQIAGGDVMLAKKMVDGETNYPYGMLYYPNADKKFEAANMFVLGTYVKEKGHYVNGIVTDVARHELSRKGIVRCSSDRTLMMQSEMYSRMQKDGPDLQTIVAWAEKMCNIETTKMLLATGDRAEV